MLKQTIRKESFGRQVRRTRIMIAERLLRMYDCLVGWYAEITENPDFKDAPCGAYMEKDWRLEGIGAERSSMADYIMGRMTMLDDSARRAGIRNFKPLSREEVREVIDSLEEFAQSPVPLSREKIAPLAKSCLAI
jgi:hypothetical protein